MGIIHRSVNLVQGSLKGWIEVKARPQPLTVWGFNDGKRLKPGSPRRFTVGAVLNCITKPIR